MLHSLCDTTQSTSTFYQNIANAFLINDSNHLSPDEINTNTNTANTESVVDKQEEIRSHITQKIDLIILSPPWGGPEYVQVQQFDITTMLPCGHGFALALAAASVATQLVYILPRNTTDAMLVELARVLQLPYKIEYIYLSRKFKLKIVYFGHWS